MTLDQVKTEAAPGEVIKSSHIDTIVDSLSSLSGTISANINSITGNVSFINVVISCTAVDTPVILNQQEFNYGGALSVQSISAGAVKVIHSGSKFSASSFIQITSKVTNVLFTVGDLFGTSAVSVVVRDTNGFATSLSSGEGFIFKVES